MAMWAQVKDVVVTTIPPDGTTSVDIYVTFSFSGDPLPEGAVVKFVVGKGSLPPETETTDEGTLFRRFSLATVEENISPIEGVELVSDTGVVENLVVKDASAGDTDNLIVRAVAKATLKPIIDPSENTITVVVYSTYDALGTATRFVTQQLSLTIAPPEEEPGEVGTFLSATQRYDTVNNAWATMTASTEGRSGPFCQEVGGKVYMVGGLNGGYSSTNEEYDPGIDAWTTREPMPEGKAFGMSVSLDGKLYVMGGYNETDGKAVSSVHSYDPGSDTWTSLASMPMPVAFGTSCVGSDGKIYVLLGGSNFTETDGKEVINRFNNSVFSYDITLDEWEVEDVKVAGAAATTLQAAGNVGDTSISIGANVAFPSYGTLTINRLGGLGVSETLTYYSHNAARGEILLNSPLTLSHASGASVDMAALPESRIGPGAVADGDVINALYGLRYSGQTSKSTASIRATAITYDVVTKASAVSILTGPAGCDNEPCLPRYRSGFAARLGDLYVIGGSSENSPWQNKIEVFDPSTSSIDGPTGYEPSPIVTYSPGSVAYGDYIYLFGGAGSGQAPGWLRITSSVEPRKIRADGIQTASVLIEAVDAAGDTPPDGVKVKVRGVIYVQLTSDENAAVQTQAEAQQAQGATTASTAPLPPQSTSILPVVFSSTDLEFVDGKAVATLLPRSEDPIKQADNLFNYAKSNEVAPSSESLKNELDPEATRNVTQTVGEKRELYSVAIESVVDDSFYNGRSDVNATISEKEIDDPDPLSFSANVGPASQKQAAEASYYSDITSIPDVYVVSEDVLAADAKVALERIREDIPFGSSPYYNALIEGVRLRNDATSGAKNLIVAASDNDQSYSTVTPADVVNEANAVGGTYQFPIFVTNFVVSKPPSLSARRSRTDVRDLEYIASGTGGNSFSVIDPSYVQFVINRIKTSAPSSIGSGTITIKHDMGGPLVSAYMAVSNVEGYGGPDGNTAEMTIWYSDDDYEYTKFPLVIPPNVAYTFDTPIKASYVKYQVSLQSQSFDSPVLTYVAINYVEPSVQYLFTYPQEVSGQVSEMASVVNYRLPTGGEAKVGLYHGESFSFDRDYEGVTQPGTGDRGTIHVINRAFNYTLDDAGNTTDEIMNTDDFVLYKARSGPWSQEAVLFVYVNGIDVLPQQYIAVPEEGALAFRRRLSPNDKVTIEVQNPSTFRVGVKLTNPSSNTGETRVLDSFAFMYGNSEDESGMGYNSPPRAVNLFVSPSPAQPGGPLVANYTFVDPEGDKEDKSKTQITWYRNGTPVPVLANKWSVSNSDIIASRSDVGPDQFIYRGQEWFFSVRPSDGKSYGPLASSPKIVIANRPPSISDVRLVTANKEGADVFTSSDEISVNYKFQDLDDDNPKSMIFTWFSGGLEVKTGGDSKLLVEEKNPNGDKIIVPGATIRCDVIPSDGSDYGAPVSSQTITVTGSTPTVTDVAVTPTSPSAVSNMRLSYKYTDVDGLADQSRVAWYKDGERITSLDDSKGVSSSYLIPGQQWYAAVTPYNGSVSGTAVKSNVVIVQF